jgi:hypothetical protein
MYEVDERDRVEPLEGVPQSSVGAPIPFLMADEHRVVLAYYMQVREPGWDGSTVRVVGPTDGEEPVALVRLNGCSVHMFGPPNDEAFRGHPLAARGLRPYGSFRISESSWIRRLERMNSVHPRHRAERYWALQHLVFTFHDSTFECVCQGSDLRTTHGSIGSVIPEMVKLLNWDRTRVS